MNEVIVRLEQIEKQYASQSASVLDHISLSIRAGETVGIRGENGAGKSTLLAIIGGIIPPDKGSVEYGSGVRGSIGYVPQDLSLYQNLSAYDNLKFWGMACGMPAKAIRARSEWLLERTGLLSRGKDPVRTYSGGMKRRLHLATALMSTPRLLLLDEPTVGADDASAEKILGLIRLVRDRGSAVVMVSHRHGELDTAADRILLLDQGRLEPVR